MSVSVTLEGSSSHRLVLSHYAPGEECQPHQHDRAQLSLLLVGGYEEDSDQGRTRADGPSVSGKPGRFEHQNRFCDAGALILALNVDAAAALDRYFVAPRPGSAAGGEALRRLAEDGAEIVALADAARSRPADASTPRPWLTQAHARLLAEPRLGVAALARSFGMHPVHFARLFREAFDQSPTALRQNRRAARAVGRLIRTSTPLAEIAVAEGFADQAHLGRAVSEATGWSPGRLRRLFAA